MSIGIEKQSLPVQSHKVVSPYRLSPIKMDPTSGRKDKIKNDDSYYKKSSSRVRSAMSERSDIIIPKL